MRISVRRTALLSAVLVGSSLLGVAAAHQAQVNTDQNGVAVGGYDVVGYFADNKAERGSSQFETQYQGATYRFASAEHRATFLKDPEHYLPQFGGFCAYGATQGHNAPVDPEAFTIVDGKLYLNNNTEVRSEWQKHRAANIRQANQQWKQPAGAR